MPSTFIPDFHMVPAAEKLTPEWFDKANNYCFYNTKNVSLLFGKNVEEIEGYATGNFSMTPFKKMFKSMKKAMESAERPNDPNYINQQGINTIGIGFIPLPLIPTKINAARAVIQKIPFEVTVTAQDPLAAQKKTEDLNFIKNKPAIQNDTNELTSQMGIDPIDLGTTKHSAVPYSDSPYGLDLNEPDELQVFVDLLYQLAVESGFETGLQEIYNVKNALQIRGLEIKDQLYYGVSTNLCFENSTTSFPDIEYVYPGDVHAPVSNLPDHSDNTHRYYYRRVTPLELFNYFSDEICDENTLNDIVNVGQTSYIANNQMNPVDRKNFNTFKMDLILCMIKSVDGVGVKDTEDNFKTLITDPEEFKSCTNKIWAQNMYVAWWLKGTKHYFGIEKLGFATREKGVEAFQLFPLNINKTQEKSAVELSVGENQKAQIADIKMQHEILKALPHGKYINLKFLRGALSGVVEGESPYTMQQLLDLAMEQNIIVGDTEGFDGKNDGNLKPFEDIPGGVKSELLGYMQVIADANSKISQFTGINEQLTGQSANPEGLIGLQKLLINQSINALYYINEAMESQYTKVFNIWAYVLQAIIKRGGKAKEQIVNLIGSKKASLIESLNEIPLHRFGMKITLGQRAEEGEDDKQTINFLIQAGVFNVVDKYMLSGLTNQKDKMALIAVRYKQWEKKQKIKAEQQFTQQQQMVQQQGQNAVAAQQAKGEAENKKIYSQGDVNANILKLAAQLGIQQSQMDFLGKKTLQQQRGQDQIDKSTQTLQAKQNIENQTPYQ